MFTYRLLNTFAQYKIATILICLFFLALCSPNNWQTINTSSLPYFIGNDFDPSWEKPKDNDTKYKFIPNIGSLIMSSGKPTNPAEWKGRPKLLVFFYATCKGVCPLITKNLIQFVPNLEDGVAIYSITINPKEDDVSVLNRYIKNYKIKNENWHFITGDDSEITLFAKETCGAEVEVYSPIKDRYEFVHTENIFLFDTDNYLRGIYRAKGDGDLNRLLNDLKKLKSETISQI
ncbi:SCO family protein [Leptospira sp. 96542]|nr:SCO family protein [Leptospira sp. 96542]